MSRRKRLERAAFVDADLRHPPARVVTWKEFREYDGPALEWIKAGHVALTPGIVEKIGAGVSMYVHTRDANTFAIAARMIDTDPASVPKGRTGANVHGEFLMRAILLCRDHAGTDPAAPSGSFPGTPQMHELTCPECSAPFDKVADHTFGLTGETTTASCLRGHRWRV